MDGMQTGNPPETPFEPYETCFDDLPSGIVHHVFRFLGPKDLCIASAVCKHWRDLNRDGVANRVWHGHFAKRWRVPVAGRSSGWQAQYGRKMRRGYGGKAVPDMLYGHTSAVHSIALLPSSNLLATGSADCTVRLWDLQAGLPQAFSPKLRGTVRAIALDEEMLACGGSQEGSLRLWRAKPGPVPATFDLSSPTRLSGHTGPIVSMASDSRSIYSGSWDCTVRIWSKETLRRVSLLAFPDWVTAVKPRGSNLLVSAGEALFVHSLATGQRSAKISHKPRAAGLQWEACTSTAPLYIEGSRDNRLVYLAGADGGISAVDLRAPNQAAMVLWAQRAPIRALAFEDPWLAAAAGDGSVLLLDAEAALKGGRGADNPAGRLVPGRGKGTRQRLTGPSGPAFCVDIADGALACGSAEPVVRTWSFPSDKSERRAITVPPLPRNSRRRRNRFAFAADSGGGEDADQAGMNPSEIPLSHSLPAHLGGTAVDECRSLPPEGHRSGSPRQDAPDQGESDQSSCREHDSGDDSDAGGPHTQCRPAHQQEVLHPYLCRLTRGGFSGRSHPRWGSTRQQRSSAGEHIKVRG